MHYSSEDMVSVMVRYLKAVSSDLTNEQLDKILTIEYIHQPGKLTDEQWETADNLLTEMGF